MSKQSTAFSVVLAEARFQVRWFRKILYARGARQISEYPDWRKLAIEKREAHLEKATITMINTATTAIAMAVCSFMYAKASSA